MTKSKNLKAVVRARMAATGERYAAARSVITEDTGHRCKACHEHYASKWDDVYYYIVSNHDYGKGIADYCLACWLGVGTPDIARMEREMEEQEALGLVTASDPESSDEA